MYIGGSPHDLLYNSWSVMCLTNCLSIDSIYWNTFKRSSVDWIYSAIFEICVQKKNKTQQRSWKLGLYYHSCPSYHYYFNYFFRFVYGFNTELPACWLTAVMPTGLSLEDFRGAIITIHPSRNAVRKSFVII